jgi:aspartyl aminopeptidase
VASKGPTDAEPDAHADEAAVGRAASTRYDRTMADLVSDLLDYIRSSPTPYHAVAETARRLSDAGYAELGEGDGWTLAPGDRRYVVRGGGSLIAFQVGKGEPAEAGLRIIGAHTDSPNLRIKPLADVTSEGYRQLAVEPYGGVLLHTWLDRDLSLAGRVSYVSAGTVSTALVDFERPLLRVPNLAIHLQREIREEGLKLNPQQHMLPIVALGEGGSLVSLLASHLAIDERDVVAFDLMTYDTLAPAVGGVDGELLFAPRLDNLASCHAALTALLAHADHVPPFTRMMVLYDHEEVGSRSAEGAGGTFLDDAIARVVAASGSAARNDAGGAAQARARAIAHSTLVSADMAHAVHPNYADCHEPGHKPVLGGGPVIKTNVNLSYASDAPATALFTAMCRRAEVEPQHFVSRSDMPCGSTIGPISSARVGLRTVDVGNPMLSMHSCREMAGTADVEPMIRVLAAYFEAV